jgi:hypothetical protein
MPFIDVILLLIAFVNKLEPVYVRPVSVFNLISQPDYLWRSP